jgi:hypothetical protein
MERTVKENFISGGEHSQTRRHSSASDNTIKMLEPPPFRRAAAHGIRVAHQAVFGDSQPQAKNMARIEGRRQIVNGFQHEPAAAIGNRPVIDDARWTPHRSQILRHSSGHG